MDLQRHRWRELLRRARRLVNGGSHGLDAFRDCYERGDRLLGQS